MALAGACFDGKNGRSGTDCTVHRTRREGKGTWICTDSDAVGIIDGTRIWIIVALFANQLVGFFKLDDAETLSAALDYTKIACGFIVFSFLSFTLTGIYTAQGDSKTPFIANLFGLAANMILDPVLILGPGPFQRFGAAGAAMATVLAQVIVTMIMLFGVILQKKENVLKGLRLFVKIRWNMCRESAK